MNAKPLALFLTLAALPSGATAQEHSPVVGVGITVPNVGLLLPINVTEHFRLEPYVLFYANRADYPVSSDTAWDSHTRFGLGVFSVAHPREGVRVYFGSRLGLLWGSTKVNGPSIGQTSTSSSGWFVGAAIGGEYSPLSELSIGGEAMIQFEYSSATSSGSSNIGPDLYSRNWYSSGALVVRFYP